jgi:hypothetical protein
MSDNPAQHADPVRTTIRVRQGKIFGWHWKFMYWDGMYRVHWWRQSDGEVER